MAYDLAHTTPTDRFTSPNGRIQYLVTFKDNGQQPNVPTINQFIEIDLPQDTTQGRQSVASAIISDLNNPSIPTVIDPVLNALVAFKNDFFPKVDAAPVSNAIKNAIKQGWLDSAYSIYSEQP